MGVALENTIYISDKAKAKVVQLMADAGIANDPSYFVRVGVVEVVARVLAISWTLTMNRSQWISLSRTME